MAITIEARLKSFLGSTRNLKVGWLIATGILIVYVVGIRPHEGAGGINNSKAIGLASETRTGPIALWRQMRILPKFEVEDSSIAGHDKTTVAGFLATPASYVSSQSAESERKMVRTSTVDLVVRKPAEAAEKIRHLAEGLGGFLISSQIAGGPDATGGSLTIRVPAERFEEARTEIRKLSLRIDSERLEAQDVTRDYVDRAATLRNLRAEEQQYLLILKQARTVKDTLDVSEKLSDVRGKIEQQQAEFDALSKQIETVAINISLRSEAETKVFGLDWRPLYQIKLAMRQGLEGLADYASAMANFVFILPTILLWLITIIMVAAAAWRVLRWLARRLFGWNAAGKTAAA